MDGSKLVMGASGFLGSHITRQLAERGDDVRVWLRPSSSTRAIDELEVERCYGELADAETLRRAMKGVDTIFYCIVDTRSWLRDSTALVQTNVDGLRHVLDAAVAMRVPKFVFCSTVGTIGLSLDRPATEDLPHNWIELGGNYIESRLAAEDLVLRYHRDHGLAAVVLNVSTTYGAHDYGPTPHGRLVSIAATRGIPVYLRNQTMEVVSIEDAARAFLLAEKSGRAGERYIISDRCMSFRQIFGIAATAGGQSPPRHGVPMPVLRTIGRVNDLAGRVLRRDVRLNSVSVRLMHIMSEMDHSKAVRELGWEPTPTPEAIRAAARWFIEEQVGRHESATDGPAAV